MTPQAPFMIAAPVAADREASLRALLATMNAAPGVVDPENGVVPFGRFERLHFARLLVLDETGMAGLALYGVDPARLGLRLVFMGDCDGPALDLLAEMAATAGEGLRRLFAHCEGFDAGTDLFDWMRLHSLPVQTNYVNRLGRTVRQVREERALQRALSARVPREPVAGAAEAKRLHRELRAFAEAQVRSGQLTLTPPQATPLGWRLRNLLHALGVPLAALVLSPLLLVSLPWLASRLHRLESTDQEHCPPPSPEHLLSLRVLEDHGLTNQFSAVGPVKPGPD